jgi:hypothetical protein
MRFLGYVLLVVLFIFATLFIVGLCLPRVRKGTKQTVYNASIETVYNTVVNNKDWKWRTSLDNLQIIETNDDFEVWEEISQGSTIRFKTKEKTPAGNTRGMVWVFVSGGNLPAVLELCSPASVLVSG